MGKDGLTANSTDATANQQLGLCPPTLSLQQEVPRQQR